MSKKIKIFLLIILLGGPLHFTGGYPHFQTPSHYYNIASKFIIFRLAGLRQMTQMNTQQTRRRVLSEDSQEISESEFRDESQIQQQPLEPGQANSYEKQYSVHKKVHEMKKFPFHRYLSHYKYALKPKEYCFLQSYFGVCQCPPSNQQMLEPNRIQLFNKLPRKFLKIPKNAIIFLHIESISQHKDVITLKNYEGEIIHFDIEDEYRKRKTLISKLNRKIMTSKTKIKRFFVILDENNLNYTFLDIKCLRELATDIKYFYVKTLRDNQQLQCARNKFQLLADLPNNIQINLNESQGYISAYSIDQGESIDYSIKLKIDLLENMKRIKQQEINMINEGTNWQKLGIRLRILDMLYINYRKSVTKTRQQFISEFMSFIQRYKEKSDQQGELTTVHLLELNPDAKVCKHCFITGNKKRSKSKYTCRECSIKFQDDITLCRNCTKKFHTLMDEVVDGQPFKDIPQKDWKRYYQKYQAYKQAHKQQQDKITKKETILKLNKKWTQISNIMDELGQSLEGVKIAKQFNEAFLQQIFKGLCESQMPNWEPSRLNWTLGYLTLIHQFRIE